MRQHSLYDEAVSEFRALLEEATHKGDPEATAMTLATADAAGRVSARTVLLKELDSRGFVFFSNGDSNKGRQLAQNPRASLVFLWKSLRNQVQVMIEGVTEQIAATESDAYFASRPRGSQIGAWASLQSQALPDREHLLARVAELEQRYQDQDIPRPPHWGGYRVVPDMIELWYGQPYRLHDRFRYELNDGIWTKQRLFP